MGASADINTSGGSEDDRPQGGSADNGDHPTQPVEIDDGMRDPDGCYYFDDHIGTETVVQTTQHSGPSRENQVTEMLWKQLISD